MPAPTFDASSSAQTNTTSLSYGHTIDANANFLVVCLEVFATSATAVDSITVNGTDITSNVIIQDQRVIPTTLTRVGSGIWYMPSPPTGAVTIIVTIAAATTGPQLISGCSSWFAVDLGSPVGASGSDKGSGAAPSVTLTSTPDDVAVDSMAAHRSLTVSPTATAGAGQTELWNLQQGIAGAGVRGCGSRETCTSTSTTMDWALSGGTDYVTTAAIIQGLRGTALLAQLGVGQ